MILADTSIWVDHLNHGDSALAALLEREMVLAHPWVIGELALGTLRQRAWVLRRLAQLPQASLARHDETLLLIEAEGLQGTGIGYVDAQLLASTRLTPEARLWTRDRRLAAVAERLSLGSSGRPA